MKREGRKSIFLIRNKSELKGQVWIETIIYTSVAIVMIGLVLSYAKPKIEEFQDKNILEQSLEMFRLIDNTIANIGVSGNQRVLEVKIKKGELIIDGENDKISFEMDSNHEYSQPGLDITDTFGGRIITHTEKKGEMIKVNFTVDYSQYSTNLTYEGKDDFKILSKAPTPYKIVIANKGKENDLTLIDINLRSGN
jgi:hypothetical protein